MPGMVLDIYNMYNESKHYNFNWSATICWDCPWYLKLDMWRIHASWGNETYVLRPIYAALGPDELICVTLLSCFNNGFVINDDDKVSLKSVKRHLNASYVIHKGHLLTTGISQISLEFGTWLHDKYTYVKLWYMITHSRYNFNCDITKPTFIHVLCRVR